MSYDFGVEIDKTIVATDKVGDLKNKIKEVAESKNIPVENTDTPMSVLQKMQDTLATVTEEDLARWSETNTQYEEVLGMYDENQTNV